MAVRSPLPKWTVPAVALAVLAIAGGVLAALWWWVNGQQWTDPAQKTTALLDVVKVASGIAVGGGGLFALYLAARRQRTQELELAQQGRAHDLAVRVAGTTEEDAAARRVTDLYATAVEQLGSEKAPVRLGGLYALERLAQDNPTQRQTIVNVLCAYLRMPFDPPDPTELDGLDPESDRTTHVRTRHQAAVQEREVRVTAQRILAAHQRPDDPGHWPDLHMDLSGATLVDANFSDCELYEAKFTGTMFTGSSATFVRTTFTGLTSFKDTEFHTNASFGKAAFNEARFDGTRFAAGAYFSNATLSRGSFDRASFAATAVFRRATIGRVAFGGATFGRQADFGEATFLGYVDFNGVATAAMVNLEFAWVAVDEEAGLSQWPDGWEMDPAVARDNRPGQWRRLIRTTRTPESAG